MISAGAPAGPHSSTCGYCSPTGERSSEETFRQSAGLQALQLSCDVCLVHSFNRCSKVECEAVGQVYQKMIDRGWRRSGEQAFCSAISRGTDATRTQGRGIISQI